MMEAVILAGGMGTRLRSVVSDVPKCMAPVADKPFLQYLLIALEQSGFDHVIFSLGYKSEVIEAWLKNVKSSMTFSSVTETTPLGTGGGIRLALSQAKENDVFVLNGDTYLNVDYKQMLAIHLSTHAQATIALKQLHHFDRYGCVDIEPTSQRILQFREKQFCESGLINGGAYIVNKEELIPLPEKFSIEKDYFEPNVSSKILIGYRTEGYFIDIGIPEDYAKSQIDFKDGRYKEV